MSASRQPVDAATDRRRKLAAIHAAATKLGMDTSDKSPGSVYRTMLHAQAGVTSAADLTEAGRRRVLAYLLQRLNPGANPPARGLTQRQLLERMWAELGKMGAINDASTEALAAFIKRQHGVDNIGWLGAPQLSKTIEAIKAMAARHAAR